MFGLECMYIYIFYIFFFFVTIYTGGAEWKPWIICTFIANFLKRVWMSRCLCGRKVDWNEGFDNDSAVKRS